MALASILSSTIPPRGVEITPDMQISAPKIVLDSLSCGIVIALIVAAQNED